MADNSFSFGASGSPAPSQSPKPAAPQAPVAGPMDPMQLLGHYIANMFGASASPAVASAPQFDLAGLLQQLHQQHIGLGNTGGPSGYVPGQNNAFNPFSNGFFRSSASQLSPVNLALSQGGTAMNQWQFPNLFHGQMAPTNTPAEGALMDAGANDPYAGNVVPRNIAPNFGPRPPGGTPAAGNWANNVEATNAALYRNMGGAPARTPPMAGAPNTAKPVAKPKGPMGSPLTSPFSF